MAISLTPEQCRVIGVMLEKETTTPDQYPLSLNALTNACNQKSNRDPVMSLSEAEVQNIVDELMALNQISDQGAFSGRVAKYSHRFCNTEFGNLQFTPQQRAIICVLLLRGAQTPGEIRTRTNRLAEFSNVNEVEALLNDLNHHNEQELVCKLAREPGKRESRYTQLFSPIEEHTADNIMLSDNNINNDNLLSRVESLEEQVQLLTDKLAQLVQK